MEEQFITIPEENIIMELMIKDQNYVIFSNSVEPQEEDLVYFAKLDEIEGKRIITDIEDDNEYNIVVAEYERQLDLLGDDDE